MAQRQTAPRMTYEEWRAQASESRRSEWVDGEAVEFVPPTIRHQLVAFLVGQVMALFASLRGLGTVVPAPAEMRLARSAREPDIFFVAAANSARLGPLKLDGPADLVVEVISADGIARDRIEKRAEYEAAGVKEYWIVDPRSGCEQIEFLALGDDGRYAPMAPDAEGRLHSVVLPGFWLDPVWLRADPLPDPLALLRRIAPDQLARALTAESAP